MKRWMHNAVRWLLVVCLVALPAIQSLSAAYAAPEPDSRPTKPCTGQEHEPNDALEHGGGCAIETGELIQGWLAVQVPTATDPAVPILDRDWFEFGWPPSAEWYLVEVLPEPGVNAWVSVQRPQGTQVGYSDSAGPGGREALYFRTDDSPRLMPVRGDFLVVGVGSTAPTTGGYTLRITRADPPAPPTLEPPTPPTAPPPDPPRPPAPPPAATSTVVPTPSGASSGQPRSTAASAGTLTWRPIGPAYQTAPLVTTVHVLVYYDVNGSRGPEPGEGVAGLSVRAVARGQFAGWGVTNAQGEAELVVIGPVDRIVVPFLNVQQNVRAGAPADVTFRLEAVRLPTFLPIEGG